MSIKVVFASHGSLGDLVPFLEIGKVLVAGGDRVVVATHAAHRGVVEGAGLTFAPMRPDRPSDRAFHLRMMHPTRGPAFVYKSYLAPAIADSDADLMAACADADILVSVTLALAAPLVAARTGIPWRSAAFQPSMLYSAIDPPKIPMLPLLRGRPQFNAWWYDKAKNGVESWAAPLRDYRRAQGLGEYDDHPAFRGQHAPGGVLALYSPLFGSIPPDAPPGTVQTGQVLQTGDAPLDPALERFLSAGERPIVFTLGSASAHAAQRFFQHSARIAKRLGRRAVMLVGRSDNLGELAPSPEIMAVTAAPYQKVFPHAAATVHQGGIGTISLAILSAAPMVLVPFSHDQPDNAARAARAGLATVVSRRLYPWVGATHLHNVLGDGALAQRLAAASAQIGAENGAENAAAEIRRAAQG